MEQPAKEENIAKVSAEDEELLEYFRALLGSRPYRQVVELDKDGLEIEFSTLSQDNRRRVKPVYDALDTDEDPTHRWVATAVSVVVHTTRLGSCTYDTVDLPRTRQSALGLFHSRFTEIMRLKAKEVVGALGTFLCGIADMREKVVDPDFLKQRWPSLMVKGALQGVDFGCITRYDSISIVRERLLLMELERQVSTDIRVLNLFTRLGNAVFARSSSGDVHLFQDDVRSARRSLAPWVEERQMEEQKAANPRLAKALTQYEEQLLKQLETARKKAKKHAS